MTTPTTTPILPPITSLPPVSSLLPPPIPPIDADSLVALNNALKFTPVEDLRDVIRSVCLSNLDVAAVLYSALCGDRGGRSGGGDTEDDDDGISEESRDVTPMGYTADDGEEDDEEGEYWNDPRGTDYWRNQEDEDSDEDEEEDEEEPEASNPESRTNINNNIVPKAAVVDLTGPDSDKENPVTAPITGTKRKAGHLPQDNSTKQALKKLKAGAPVANSTTLAGQIHFKDRYKHCSNCYELFDVTTTPCHSHKDGPKRTPGPRERMEGSQYGGSDDTENEEEDEDDEDEDSEDEDVCDCIYHSGSLYADMDMFADHDERCHGTIDNDWTKREYPDNYIWTRCDQAGTADGCKMGRHEVESVRTELAGLNAAGGLKKSFRYTF